MSDEKITTTDSPDIKLKSSREIHNNLEIFPSFEQTFIIVAASHHDNNKNFVNRISCKKGLPIGGYTYDSQSDSYFFECADYFHLGYIPISFMAKMKGIQGWQIRVPASENVIKRHLTALQKKELRNFKNAFKAEEYFLHYIQMIDPN